MNTGIIKVKVRSGKIDEGSLEQEIKRRLPGYDEYEFEYLGNKVFVQARKKEMAPDTVELFVFQFFKR